MALPKSHTEHQNFVFHNIAMGIADQDIYIFLEYNSRLSRDEWLLDAGRLDRYRQISSPEYKGPVQIGNCLSVHS